MASISVTVPDAIVTRVLDAICDTYDYRGPIDGTKAQFAKKQVAEHIRRLVTSYEARQASEAAAQAAADAAAADLSGIN